MGAYSFIDCLSHLIADHASLARRNAVVSSCSTCVGDTEARREEKGHTRLLLVIVT